MGGEGAQGVAEGVVGRLLPCYTRLHSIQLKIIESKMPTTSTEIIDIISKIIDLNQLSIITMKLIDLLIDLSNN